MKKPITLAAYLMAHRTVESLPMSRDNPIKLTEIPSKLEDLSFPNVTIIKYNVI